MKKLLFVATLVVATSLIAETREELLYKYTGGNVTKPAIGKLVVVNSQSRIPQSTIAETAGNFLVGISLGGETVSASGFSIAEAGAAKDGYKANAVVFVVDDKNLPMTLLAPESAWAVVNVAAVASNNGKIFEMRVSKLLIRTIVQVLGGYTVPGDMTVTAGITSIRELDELPNGGTASEALFGIVAHSSKLGFVPARSATYLEACRQGWAAAPTNDIQRAIWKSVNELPAKPIKINFDPKTDKE